MCVCGGGACVYTCVCLCAHVCVYVCERVCVYVFSVHLFELISVFQLIIIFMTLYVTFVTSHTIIHKYFRSI